MSAEAPVSPADRRLPPVEWLAVASMVLVIVGGIYLATYIPRRPPLGAAVGLVIGGAALCLASVVTLARIKPFAWSRFFLVARYTLLAYVVIAGLLEFVFVRDGTRGSTLVVLSCMLATFAVDVPIVLAFTVARYQEIRALEP